MPTPISIILCTRNRAEDLRRTLASIALLDIPTGFSAELVLVDNGSDDHTLEVMRSFDAPSMSVCIVQEPRPGKARACNAGILASSGTILLFTDDDVRLPECWIDAMCTPILAGIADAVAGGVVLPQHLYEPWMQMAGAAAAPGITETLSKDHPQRLVGASMSFARYVLEKVSLFDTELGPGALGLEEETLFSLQLTRAGYKITSAFDAPVEHHVDPQRLSRTAFLSAAQKLGRSNGYIDYHWRHLHKGRWEESSPRLYLALVRAYVVLLLARFRNWMGGRQWSSQGVHRRETLALRRLYAVKQVILERKRSRNYDQYGLTHRFSPSPTEATFRRTKDPLQILADP